MKPKRKIILFVLLTFAISSISYYVMITERTGKTLGAFFMWSPGLAAILTQLIDRKTIKGFGWKLPGRNHLLLGIAIPLLYASLIYGVVWITGVGGFAPISWQKILLFSIAGLFFACAAALGEEIGWRGFLFPELLKITSFNRAALFTGLIWSVWHFPAIIYTEYNNQTPLVFQLVVFTVTVIGLSFLSAWLTIQSGSIWPAVLWHGGHNLFIQQIFLSMTTGTEISEYFVDDFGLGLMAVCILMILILWRRRFQLDLVAHLELQRP